MTVGKCPTEVKYVLLFYSVFFLLLRDVSLSILILRLYGLLLMLIRSLCSMHHFSYL